LLGKRIDTVPLVGARKRNRIDEALGALDIELSPSDVEQIERAVPPDTVAGTRYNAYLMSQLDSENTGSSSRTA
jgi:pyridoxine 4-dehydrogenase